MFCLSNAIHLDTWEWPGDFCMSALAFSEVLESLCYKNKVQCFRFLKWFVLQKGYAVQKYQTSATVNMQIIYLLIKNILC